MMKRIVILRRCHPPPPPEASMAFTGCCRGVRYGKCLRNHAARMGGYAVDGCREFLAEAEEGTSGALRCAACGCHRNFHRRVLLSRYYCSDADADETASDSGRWDCSAESTASSSTTDC